MRVWIVNYYTGIPDRYPNPRYVQFAKYFMAKGWEVTTFNANCWGTKSTPLFERKQYGTYDFVHVKSPHYVGNGLKRMFSIWKYAWNIYRHAGEFEHPDVILHNVHAPFDFPVVWAAKKLKAKYISEVWDLWPDNFVKFGLVSRNNLALKLFYWVEKRIYENADQLVFTLAGATDYLKRKGWTTETGGKIDLSRVHYINNGIDLEQFDCDREAYPRSDDDINNIDYFKVVYLGALNNANHVQTLIDAAEILKKNECYHFFIYGNGTHRKLLEKTVRERQISNVHFKERHIPLCECAWVVSQARVNVMTYEYGFGYMGVSSGKMFQYLAAGKPIVCNVHIAYDDIITDNNLGIARDLRTAEEFAMAIRELAEQSEDEYNNMCSRVRQTAQRFDYKRLAGEEIKVLESCVNE